MVRDRALALQDVNPDQPLRMVPITITATSPLTVRLPGGSTVTCTATPGLTYTVGKTGWAFYQQPAVIAVLPNP